VLWSHYVSRSYEGVNAVVTEATELDRLTQLCSAIPCVLASVSDASWWHDESTARLFGQHAATLVAREHQAGTVEWVGMPDLDKISEANPLSCRVDWVGVRRRMFRVGGRAWFDPDADTSP
jgi:hypothetical protein